MAVGQDGDGVVCRGITVHGDGIECAFDGSAQSAIEQRGRDGRVRGDEREHRGHVRLDHSRAFGAAEQANLLPADAAFGRGPFRARIRGHDRAGEFLEGAGFGAACEHDMRHGSQDFFHTQRRADHTC